MNKWSILILIHFKSQQKSKFQIFCDKLEWLKDGKQMVISKH